MGSTLTYRAQPDPSLLLGQLYLLAAARDQKPSKDTSFICYKRMWN